MSTIHVMWAQGYQPLTRHSDPMMEGLVFNVKPNNTTYRCHDCRMHRAAKNLLIRVEYDYSHIKCAEPDHGGRWTVTDSVSQ